MLLFFIALINCLYLLIIFQVYHDNLSIIVSKPEGLKKIFFLRKTLKNF